MCSRISWCFGRSYFVDNFRAMSSNLDELQRNFVNIRYLRMIKNLEESTKRSGFFYYTFSMIVTVGFVMVPSFISIQDRTFKYNANESELTEHSNNIYWSVWGISLSVTLSNAFIKLLRLDQTYISRNLRLNQLRSEGIMFITGTDDYAGLTPTQKFNRFTVAVEKLKSLQMQQEFTQSTEFERRPEDNTITML